MNDADNAYKCLKLLLRDQDFFFGDRRVGPVLIGAHLLSLQQCLPHVLIGCLPDVRVANQGSPRQPQSF